MTVSPGGSSAPAQPWGAHLADEPWDEQQHQDAVVVAAVAQEAVRHEGGEQGDVPVGLLHLHLAQLHLDGLQQHSPEPLSPAPGTAPGTQQLLQDGAAAESCTEEKAAGADVQLPVVCSAPGAQQAHSSGVCEQPVEGPPHAAPAVAHSTKHPVGALHARRCCCPTLAWAFVSANLILKSNISGGGCCCFSADASC